MNQKTEQLKELEKSITDFVFKFYNPEWKFQSKHHVLWSGNPDAKIIIAQMCPDRTELSWALKENIHDNYVLHNPSGNILKRTLQRAGFDIKNDFFYVNVIPFMRVAGIKYTSDVTEEFSWIFEKISTIIKPGLIISLGCDAFQAITKEEIPVKLFETYTCEGALFDFDDTQISPLEDPAVIEIDNPMKHRPFYETIRRLYVKTHKLREQNGR